MTNCPYHSNFIDIVESVFCIYKYKYPILRNWLSVPNNLNSVDGNINSRSKSSANLVILKHAGGFRYHESQHAIIKKASLCFSYSNQVNTRLFIKRNQAAIHKCMIGRPGWDLIGYPVDENFNTSKESFAVSTEFQKPTLYSFRVLTSRPQTSQKGLCEKFNHIVCNFHRIKNDFF